MSMKASDYSCVPLCADCHTRGPLAYHRIGKRAFERVHTVQFRSIVARLRREWKRESVRGSDRPVHTSGRHSYSRC
jgi:hypothetical protein